MRNVTFVISGKSSEMTSVFFPPIALDSTRDYHIGLLSLDTYNSIPNIRTGVNDQFTICNSSTCHTFNLTQGAYEIGEIEREVEDLLRIAYEENNTVLDQEPSIIIRASPITKRVHIKSNYTIDLSHKQSFADMLGFEHIKLAPNKVHISSSPVDIAPVNTVSVECSIAQGSYKNGMPSHDIYQFAPGVSTGYIINERPQNIIYYPINTHILDSVTVRLVDDKGDLVDFGGEDIIIRLHIKEWA